MCVCVINYIIFARKIFVNKRRKKKWVELNTDNVIHPQGSFKDFLRASSLCPRARHQMFSEIKPTKFHNTHIWGRGMRPRKEKEKGRGYKEAREMERDSGINRHKGKPKRRGSHIKKKRKNAKSGFEKPVQWPRNLNTRSFQSRSYFFLPPFRFITFWLFK